MGIPRPLVRTNQGLIVAAVLVALLTGMGWLLAIPLLIGVVALVWKNPLFLAARPLLRKPPATYPQEDRAQQRFNQVLSVSLLFLALASGALHLVILQDVFAVMVGLAALVAMLGYCIGCAVRYRLLMLRERRRALHASD